MKSDVVADISVEEFTFGRKNINGDMYVNIRYMLLVPGHQGFPRNGIGTSVFFLWPFKCQLMLCCFGQVPAVKIHISCDDHRWHHHRNDSIG